ncbi:PEP-utilizing enzyme [Nanoarchaeota archaeon]
MAIDINPQEYSMLFNWKVSVIWTQFELEERRKLQEEGYPNIELLYINGQWFFRNEDLAKYDMPDSVVQESIDRNEKRANEMVEFSEQHKDVQGDKSRLLEVYFKFLSTLRSYIRIVDVPLYFAEHFEEKFMNSVLEHGFTEKDFDKLLHPLSNTYHQKRHRDLLLVNLGKMSRKEFMEKWKWSQMVVLRYKPVDDDFLDEQLSHVKDAEKELQEIEESHKNAVKEYDLVYEKLSAELKKKADLMQRLYFIRDYRIMQIHVATYNMYEIFNKLANKMGIKYIELINMKQEEVESESVPKDIKERLSRYAYFGNQIYLGKDVDYLDGLFNKAIEAKSVTGRGVSKGVVQGPVRIVQSADKLYKVQEGDIIICDMTTPDYMPGLRKVAAIVTNIGGFTCHSAVVAREFKIPCVVGTRNATHAFKDGDIVEVDADKGKVTLIERPKTS